MSEASGNARPKASVAYKQTENRIMRLAGRAVEDFGMIREGDKVLVCMSGGKDSFVMLDVLLKLQARAPVDFSILALNVDQNLPDYPHEVLPAYFEAKKVPYRIERQDTWSIITRLMPEGRNVCSLCSRLRRGIIYRVAGEEGATKIALGHHADDVLCTLLLNMFHSGRMKAMPPILKTDNRRNVVIRPLAYVRESLIAKYASWQDYPIIGKQSCRKIENRQRKEMKELLADWDRRYPGRVHNLLMSLSRVSPSHLMDKSLYDFEELPEDPMTQGSIRPL